MQPSPAHTRTCASYHHTTRRLPQVSQPVQFKCSLLCAGLRWPCSVWRGVVTFKHVNNAAVKPSRRWRGGGGTSLISRTPSCPWSLHHSSISSHQPALRHAFCPPPLVTERSSQKPQSRTIKQNVIHHYPVRRRI